MTFLSSYCAHAPLCQVEERFYAPGQTAQSQGSAHKEIRWIVSGSATWQFGTRTRKVGEGDILLIPARLKESWKTDAVTGLSLMLISLSPEWSKENAVTFSVSNAGARIVRHRRLSAELALTMRDCLAEKTREQPGWADFVESQVRIFLVKLHRHLQRDEGAPHSSLPISEAPGDLHRRVLNYIRKLDLLTGEPDTIETAAEKLAISPRRFTDLFREITGMSRLEYVHTQRLRRAKELLITRGDSIENAAYQAGFEDLTTFYRVFRRREGMTPGAWRNYHQPAENEATGCRKRQ